MKETCNLCDDTRIVAEMKDRAGRIYRGCRTHARYVPGWIQDANAEIASVNAAAKREERAAHGRRDDDDAP